MSDYPATPECDRMHEVIDEHDTQTVGDFLDWALSAGFHLCTWNDRLEQFDPVHKSVEQWLAARHGIDLDKVDAEKKAILEHLRRQHEIADLQQIAADTAS